MTDNRADDTDGAENATGAGAETVAVAVRLFYDRMLADTLFAGRFDGIDMARLMAHQRAFVVSALGGADLYVGRNMHAAHLGVDVTQFEFDAAVVHLAASLTEAGIAPSVITALPARLEPLRRQIVA